MNGRELLREHSIIRDAHHKLEAGCLELFAKICDDCPKKLDQQYPRCDEKRCTINVFYTILEAW